MTRPRREGPVTRFLLSGWPYALLGLTSIAVGVGDCTQGQWLYGLNIAVLGFVWMMFPFLRRRWMATAAQLARTDVAAAAREAMHRGISWDEWYHAEFERTFGRTEG